MDWTIYLLVRTDVLMDGQRQLFLSIRPYFHRTDFAYSPDPVSIGVNQLWKTLSSLGCHHSLKRVKVVFQWIWKSAAVMTLQIPALLIFESKWFCSLSSCEAVSIMKVLSIDLIWSSFWWNNVYNWNTSNNQKYFVVDRIRIPTNWVLNRFGTYMVNPNGAVDIVPTLF